MDNEKVEVQNVEPEIAEPVAEEKKEKKNDHRAFIITIIIILLLFGIGAFIFLRYFVPSEDPDITITKLINKSVKTEASNSYEGYRNAYGVGYILDDLLLSKESRVVLWDSKNDCYVLYDGNEFVYSPIENPSTGTDLWIFVNKAPESSKFSVYSTEIKKTTKQVEVSEGNTVDQDFYFTEHQYSVTKNGNTITYSCTEEDCGFTYDVKVEK